MTPLRRWLLVAVVALAVVAAPQLPRLLPASAGDVSAAELLSRVQASGGVPYQGYVETDGSVHLAVGDDFSDLGELLGDRLRLRVWWDGEDAWRVNRLLLTGEEDLVHAGDSTTAYDYERARAVRTRDPDIRFPRTADLLPPSLARITTEDAGPDEVTLLPARRVAGVAAAGLRLVPASDDTTVDRVDLWVEEETGLALAVEVYAAGSERPVVDTRFAEFSSARPAAEEVRPTFSGQVELEDGDVVDLADAANRYAPFVAPSSLAGLERRPSDGGGDGLTGPGAVGVYGSGVTRLIAVPLREQDAEPLREALLASPTAEVTDDGTLVAVGPLSVYLTTTDLASYVLAGTVTAEAIVRAADDLAAGVRLRRGFR